MTTETTEPRAADLTFEVGQRAVLDLRDSSGAIALKDWDEPTLRISAEGEPQPYVLQDGDTFRIRMGAGSVTLPTGLPTEALVPPAVNLRIMRVMRAGGETLVRPVTPGSAGEAPAQQRAGTGAEPVSIDEFAREMSQTAQRIFERMTQAVRAGNTQFGDEVARRLDEGAERIDEQARRVAERLAREVERANESVARAQEHARRAAERAEEQAHRVAERVERRASRMADRAERRGGRGRWWFADRMEEAAAPPPPASAGPSGAASPAATEERRAILAMLSEGKITSDQAARLLDALNG